MSTFQIQTISSSSNCIVAARQPARRGTILLLTIALSAVCIALLAACGGGGSGGGNGNGGNGTGNGNGTDNDTTPNSFPSVSNLKIIRLKAVCGSVGGIRIATISATSMSVG